MPDEKTPDATPQDRIQFAGWTEDEKARLMKHMLLEEEREKTETKKFELGEKRMEQIEADLRPIKKMYYAVVGSAGVGLMLLATLLFIYNTDRAGVTAMQDALYKQGTAIEKLLQSHQELERDYRRDMSRVERDIERMHPYKASAQH